jgi:hypothetical protein
MQQPLLGQQEPPPQQSSSLIATGVAAVSVISVIAAARMSKYFITPPFEFGRISAAIVAPSRCGEGLSARRRDRRAIGACFTASIFRKNPACCKYRQSLMLRCARDENKSGTRRWTAVRRLRTRDGAIAAFPSVSLRCAKRLCSYAAMVSRLRNDTNIRLRPLPRNQFRLSNCRTRKNCDTHAEQDDSDGSTDHNN